MKLREAIQQASVDIPSMSHDTTSSVDIPSVVDDMTMVDTSSGMADWCGGSSSRSPP